MTARLLDAGAGAPVANPRQHRVSLLLSGSVAFVLVAVLLMAGVASARSVHVFSGSFGSAGTGNGELALADVSHAGGASGVAIDTVGGGDVLVVDTGNNRVQRFDAAGAYQSQFGSAGAGNGQLTDPTGVAVDNSGVLPGAVYVLDHGNNRIEKFTAAGAYAAQLTGTPGGPFGEIYGVATDAAGHVWVYQASAEIDEFAADGTFLQTFSCPCGTSPGLAVNSNGLVFSDRGSGVPAVMDGNAAGTYLGDVTTTIGAATGLAADPANGDLYVDQGTEIERFASTDVLGSVVEKIGAGHLTTGGGLAVNASGGLYVADAASNTVAVFALANLPDVSTSPVTAIAGTTATFNATVNPGSPPAGSVTDCHFDYVTDDAYRADVDAGHDGYTDLVTGGAAPCAALPTGGSPVSVHADVTGLAAATVYHVRSSAANADGTSHGQDVTFNVPGAPGIGAVSIDSVSTTSARARAEINPNFGATSYHIDYGTDVSYGRSTAESSTIGSDHEGHPVNLTLTDLTPGTAYHWRIVATNAAGTTNGGDQTFKTYDAAASVAPCANDALRTGASAALPDCRAYEQASPADKAGAAATLLPYSVAVAPDGDGVLFTGAAGLPGIGGYTGLNAAYVSRRSADGWSTGNFLMDASTSWSYAQVFGWSDDLLHTFAVGTFDGSAGNIAVGDLTDGSYRTLGAVRNQGAFVADFSADGSTVLFESSGQLVPEAIPGVTNLYIWNRGTGTLRLAGVLPDGSTPAAGAGAGGSTDYSYYKINTLSDDGSRAFFTDAATGQLYMRKNATSAAATTVAISASQKTNGSGPGGTDPDGPQRATFRAVTPTGSKVLFTSSEELTDDANTGPTGQGADLYSYDVASGVLTDLTVDDDADGADVQGVLGTSDDGSYVYFAANGELAAGAAPGDCAVYDAGSTGCSLYVLHNGTTSFIARFSPSVPGDVTGDPHNWTLTSDRGPGLGPLTARVTPDGRNLLFVSKGQLSAAATTAGPSCGESPGAGCRQVYRYDAPSSRLECVSCNPTGAAALAEASLGSVPPGFAANIVAATLTHNLSSDGNRVFFESSDPLVQNDTNNAKDVYEWEAAGHGSCSSAEQNGGCLYLLSTGRSEAPSYFGGVSASGDDAFVFTTERLVGQDVDGSLDGYDARVGGGLSAQNPATPPAPCDDEGCHGTVTTAPEPPLAASVTFVGSGNAPGRPAAASRLGKVSVSTKVVKGSSFLLAAKVPGAGAVTASGSSIRSTARTARKAQTLRLRIGLTPRAKRTLSKKKRLTVRLKITFKPRSGPKSTANVVLTVKA